MYAIFWDIGTETPGELNKDNFNKYTGKVGTCNILYYFRDKNWQKDELIENWPPEIKEMIHIFESNPRGYLQRVTKDWIDGEIYFDGRNTDKLGKIIEEMDLEVGGDVTLFCTSVAIYP